MSEVACDVCGILGECKEDFPIGWTMDIKEVDRITIYDNPKYQNYIMIYYCNHCRKDFKKDITFKQEEKET